MSTTGTNPSGPTVAIFPAGGFGTRRLPVSAAIPKEFLPIGNRPVIDYTIDELVAAGVTDIYMVVHAFQRPLFEHYFQGYDELDAHLERKHKTDHLEQLRALRRRANFHFIDDSSDGTDQYGTTVPLRIALEAIGDLPLFFYCNIDDFMLRRDGGNNLAELIKLQQQTGAAGGLLGAEAALKQLTQTAVLITHKKNGVRWLDATAEKPAHPEQYPEPRLSNVGSYLFTDAVRPLVIKSRPNADTGEYMITDILNELAAKGGVVVSQARGTYYDSGTLENWLTANRELSGGNQ